MNSVVLQAESLNLPEIFSIKLRGKKVELTENGDTIMINPVKSPVELAGGIHFGNDDANDVDWDERFPPTIDTKIWAFNREEANER